MRRARGRHPVRRRQAPARAAHCSASAPPAPPSSAELSDEPMSVQSAFETKRALDNETKRLHYGTVYAAPASGESTTDKSYSGLCLVVDDGETLAESEKRLRHGRQRVRRPQPQPARACARPPSPPLAAAPVARYAWELEPAETKLTRRIKREPFVPDEGIAEFAARCLDIQATGLIKRMEYTELLASRHRRLRRRGLHARHARLCPRDGQAGPAAQEHRRRHHALLRHHRPHQEQRRHDSRAASAPSCAIIPIGESVKKHFETIGHDLGDHSVVFENAQARERTMVLLDIANKVNGLDVGTKDLSEQADGWCTYNGDQISNYDINAGLTKTMVRAVVKYVADTCDDAELAAALHDIWDTPVTPELLPIGDEGELLQKSEDSVGPYILQDFFLCHMVMRGGSPEKVLRLAEIAFEGEFDSAHAHPLAVQLLPPLLRAAVQAQRLGGRPRGHGLHAVPARRPQDALRRLQRALDRRC